MKALQRLYRPTFFVQTQQTIRVEAYSVLPEPCRFSSPLNGEKKQKTFVWNLGGPNDADAGTDAQCVDEVCQCLSDHVNVSVSDCVDVCLFIFVCLVIKLAVVYIFKYMAC